MNKDFLQRVFNAKTGQVFVYSGTGSNAEITEQFVAAAGNNLLDTVVVNLPQFGSTVIYVNDMTITVDSGLFTLFTDLIPDPEPVVEEPAAPTEGI